MLEPKDPTGKNWSVQLRTSLLRFLGNRGSERECQGAWNIRAATFILRSSVTCRRRSTHLWVERRQHGSLHSFWISKQSWILFWISTQSWGIVLQIGICGICFTHGLPFGTCAYPLQEPSEGCISTLQNFWRELEENQVGERCNWTAPTVGGKLEKSTLNFLLTSLAANFASFWSRSQSWTFKMNRMKIDYRSSTFNGAQFSCVAIGRDREAGSADLFSFLDKVCNVSFNAPI